MRIKTCLAALFLGAALQSAALAEILPGEKFHIHVSDLPKPYATPAVMNPNIVVPPAGRGDAESAGWF